MANTTIASGSTGVILQTPNETIFNNGYVTNDPSSTTYNGALYDALTIYNGSGSTLVNSGTFSSSYFPIGTGSGNQSTIGVLIGGTGIVTNTPTGIIRETGGFGNGLEMSSGVVVNYGLISGGPHYGYGRGIYLQGTGFISNASGGTINNGGIDAAGLATIVNAGQILGEGASSHYHYGDIVLEKGGTITNTGTIKAESGSYGIKIEAGNGTVINAGTISSGSDLTDNFAVTLAAGYTNLVVIDPGASFIGTVDGGSTAHSTLELGSGAATGTLTGFNSKYINFGTLTFAPDARWLFETGTANIPGIIDGFVQGDTIDLTGFTAASIATLSGNKGVVLTNSANTHATLSFGGAITNFEFTTGSFGTDLTTICFCAGTLIRTPDGETRVEKLRPGDLIATAHNGPREVRWIGKGKVLATCNRRSAATPVIVRKHALAHNVPHQDLRVTKAHSLYIDGILVPVEFLVNHRTILWDDRAQEVEIYHVELSTHDVLFANGAPAETYRDDGNRWLFENANPAWDAPPPPPYAPVLTGGLQVDAIWHRLLDRAAPLNAPPLTRNPDLHLIVDGLRVDAQAHRNSAYTFCLSSKPTRVVIASRSAVPSELGLARDPRPLGVALRRLEIRQGARYMLIDADDERLAAGFHGYEPADRLRWTDGHAELPIEAFARFDTGAEVFLHLGGTTQYVDPESAQQAA